MVKSTKTEEILFWSAVTMAVLLGILFFGLRPKGLRLHNPVSLVPEKGAIAFKRNGIAYVDNLVSLVRSGKIKTLTIEMAVKSGPGNPTGWGALLMLHDGNDQRQLFTGQWKSSIVVMNGDDYDHSRNLPRLGVKDALLPGKSRLITIVAGNGETRLYIDGELAVSNSKWQLQLPQEGPQVHMVIGNSANGKNSWIGEFYGLALYGSAFSAEKVKRSYDVWQQQGRFPYDKNDNALAIYTFRSSSNNQVNDLSGHHQPLYLPEKPIVLKKEILTPPWHHFKMNRSFFIDATINFIGFIPLGIALFGLQRAIQLSSGKLVILTIMVASCLLSLGIEIMQAWMPTRSSSMLDLVLNTLGAWLGMGLFAMFIRLESLTGVARQ